MTQNESEISATRLVAQRVKERRRDLDMTGKALAEAMTSFGVKWDRSVVANLESGRRRFVTVEEVLALAYVLSVPPVDLLLPPDDDTPYRVTQQRTEPARVVREWIRGTRPLDSESTDTAYALRRVALLAGQEDVERIVRKAFVERSEEGEHGEH